MKAIPRMNVAKSFLFYCRLLLIACAIQGVTNTPAHAAEDKLATTELLPFDKFDEYLPGETLPHPWHTIGQFSDNLKVLLQPWAESRVTGNLYSGKGVEIFDNSPTDGQGIGFGMTFTQAPVGPILLAFDYRVDKRVGEPDSIKLAVHLGRGVEHGLELLATVKDGLQIKTFDGSLLKLYDCEPARWYHVSVVGNTQSTDVKISITPHTNPKKVGFRSMPKPGPYVDVKLAHSLGQPTDVTFTSVAEAKATGAWNIDNVCLAGEVTSPRERWWPFVPDLSNADPKRKVFAYYFPPFGAGRMDGDPTLGWAFWSWQNLAYDLDPRRRDAGCKMQYIAIPRVPDLSGDKYRAKEIEMQEEVKLGQMMGMDGFIMDFNHKTAGGWNWFNMIGDKLLDAAAKTDGKFSVIPAIYSSSSGSGVNGEADAGCTPQQYAEHERTLKCLKHPGTFKNEDGKAVMSMWLTERHSPKWWSQSLDLLQKQGVPAALFTQFNSMGKIKEFSPIAYGMGHWGPRAPTDYGWYKAARPYTDVLAYPIVAQDARTRGASLVEAQNSRTIRKLWMDAITMKADWAVINTWTDYTEQAQMPSTAIGFTLFDLNAYYTHWFKTRKQPAIVRDVLYYCHRRQHTDAPQMHGVRWNFHKDMNINDSPEHNEIELLAFLKEPGTLLINVDGKIHRHKADAGITSFMVPLPKDKRFVPYFAVERDGSQVLGGKGRYTIYDKVDFPNLLYHYGAIVK